MTSIGHNTWVLPEGSPGADVLVLNTGDADAHLQVTCYFADRDPVGPYRVDVPARRTRQIRFDDLTDPEPVPRDLAYSSVVTSDRPVVVQHPAVGLPTSGNKLDHGL